VRALQELMASGSDEAVSLKKLKKNILIEIIYIWKTHWTLNGYYLHNVAI
jgi:hypothetical protein